MNLVMVEQDPEVIGFEPGSRRICELFCGDHTLYTIERPWIPNTDAPDGLGAGKPHYSCVPYGIYDLVLRKSPQFGEQYHLVNPELGVFLNPEDREHDWQRYWCMLHPANFWYSVQGCIGPGKAMLDFGAESGWGVTGSVSALAIINDHLRSFGPDAKPQLQILAPYSVYHPEAA